jgi:SAM-dependent methyltransferase
MLSKKGASIVGIDISKKQISHAVAMEKEHPLGIRYEVGSPHSWKTNALFDKVVTVLSIQYAKDFDGLLEFFALAHRQLKPGGEFVSVTFNPKFKRYGKVLYNRRFTKQPNRKMRVDFFGEKEFSATFSDLTIQDYVRAAKLAGFNKLKWEKVSIAKTGLLKLGSFWKGFLGDCPYIAFVARK